MHVRRGSHELCGRSLSFRRPAATKEKILQTHKQLMLRNHPDNGGTSPKERRASMGKSFSGPGLVHAKAPRK